MLKKLRQHWNVNGLNLVLIIATFALGGSLCGWAGRKLLLLTGIEKGLAWLFLYILLITLLWPFAVLIVSIPLGQFAFFKRYITRVWNKIRGKKMTGIKRVAIFASGAGSNAKKIIEYFDLPERKKKIRIALIVCNKPGAGVLNIAKENDIPVLLIEKEKFIDGDAYLPELKDHAIDLIILAGFLWKLPVTLINNYQKKIINIHPALLPKYGGKGMYGSHVHEAVIANKEKESGISIHYADELYDHGEIIFQAKCEVNDSDTPETLAWKIHALEHLHYPVVIESVLKKQNLR
ncbi:MAG: phosphoribosylglycinamide formyltransferase [Ferruginibacter sp.]